MNNTILNNTFCSVKLKEINQYNERKRKMIKFILLFLFIPCVFMFSGCKDDSYKLSNLESDYQHIAENCENVYMVDNKIVFDYDNFTIGETKYLTECIDEVAPYTSIQNYNIIFNNLMGFVYEYIDVCSSDNIEVDEATRDKIKFQLDEFSQAVYDVDVYIGQWAKIIEFNYDIENKDDIINSQCLSRFKTLLIGYNNLFQKSISLGNCLSSLYYNNALNDANPRIDNVELENFDSSVIISKLQGRVKYEISNLSQLFVEIYIDGNDLPTYLTNPIIVNEGKDDETITFNSFSLNQTDFEYLNMVDDINRAFGDDFDAETAVEVANAEGNKQSFYNLSVKAYNLQNVLENDNSLFVRACKNVQYSNINYSEVNEKQNKEIIDNYKFIVEEYHDVLSEMLDIVIL